MITTSTKSIKPSFLGAMQSKNNEDFIKIDNWLSNLHKLVRHGDPVPEIYDVEVSTGIRLTSDYQNLTLRMQSAHSGNVNITNITGGTDNQKVTFEGSDAVKTVTFKGGGNLRLKGGSDFVGGKHDIVSMHYNKGANLWIECYRSINS